MSKTEYRLIPMSEITDEAREIAVAWIDNYVPNGSIMPEIAQKQKLASDIMNYADQRVSEVLNSQWVSVKERLPEDRFTPCLVFNGDAPEYNQHVFQASYYTQTKEFVPEGVHSYLGAITHWMPLPSPPLNH